MPVYCKNIDCTNFIAGPFRIIGYNTRYPGHCKLHHHCVDEGGQCLEIDPTVISVDGGHGSLNKRRKCPECYKPTILSDSGFENCSECNWSQS